jgi:hypothetical protein
MNEAYSLILGRRIPSSPQLEQMLVLEYSDFAPHQFQQLDNNILASRTESQK